MNIFILDRTARDAAKANADAHVRSGILETCMMMAFAYDEGDFLPWKWIKDSNRYCNHPFSRWVRRSLQNFDWTLQHSYALCDEFYFRFNKSNRHKCHDYIDWIAANIPIKNLPSIGPTDPPRCFGDWKEIVGVSDNVYYDYRRYYMAAKRHLAVWTKRPMPDWYR